MKKRVWAMIMILVMSVMLLPDARAKAAETEIIEVSDTSKANFEIIPGTTQHISIPLRAKSGYPKVNSITVKDSISAVPFIVDNIGVYSSFGYQVQYINPTDGVTLEFDITTDETATIGQYPINVEIVYTSGLDYDANGDPIEKTDTLSLKASVKTEKLPIQLTVSDTKYTASKVIIGKKFDVSFLVKNEGEIDAYNVFCTLGFDKTGLAQGYSVDDVKLADLAAGKSTTVKLPIEVLPDVEAGRKEVSVTLKCKNKDGKEFEFSRKIYITIPQAEEVGLDNAKLQLSAVDLNTTLETGKEAELQVKLENIGIKTAKDIKIKITSGIGVGTGILPRYATEGITMDKLASGKNGTVKIPLLLAEDAVTGLKEIIVEATYFGDDKVERTSVVTLYVTVASVTEELLNEVVISNVSQNPAQPEAGKEIEVSFSITNKGNRDITNVRLAGTNLMSGGFEPLNSEPYQSVGTIAAGASKNVTMKFKVGKEIATGLNTLSIICSYKDASDKQQEEKTDLYILNVVNNSDSGRPKLIVSDFTTDQEVLRAGTTFNYGFKLVNTHASKAAKNIKVTISQAQNMFAPASGGNSFFIQSIPAGESRDCSIELKVSHEVSTASYDVSILVEYEYDDMTKTDTDNGGIREDNIVKLAATENARPEVQNIYMYDAFTYSDTPTVGSNCNMNFEFYNMGRSALNNVFITIEGDFTLATGSMHYIGSVAPGSGEYIDCEIIPNIEGEAVCNVVVHFEDSNGDEVTKTTEHTVYVQGAQASPFPDDYTGGDDWQGGDITPVGPVEEPKEPIVKLWLFIVIQVAVLVVGLFVTRGIIIGVHKSKLKKKAEAE